MMTTTIVTAVATS